MSAMSNYLENKLIDFLMRNVVFTVPTTLYFALYTVSPTDAGGGTEVAGGSYARVAVAGSPTNFSATDSPSSTASNSNGNSGTSFNLIDIQFPAPTANWGTVVAMAVWDAASAGNMLFYGAVSPSKTINSGDLPPKWSIGQWALQLDN